MRAYQLGRKTKEGEGKHGNKDQVCQQEQKKYWHYGKPQQFEVQKK